MRKGEGELALILNENFRNKDHFPKTNPLEDVSTIIKYLILQAGWNWNSICGRERKV